HTIGGIEYTPSQLSVFIYVEDMVGLSSVVPLSPAAKNAALLTLDSPIRSIQYSRQTSLKVPLTLSLLDQSQIYHIDQLKSDWSLYKLSLARSPSILETTQSFESEINLPLGASDGLYLFKIKAQQANGDTRSNERSFSVILDRLAPSLKAGQIDVPNGVLEDKALISVDWLAEDSNGIVRQTIEIQSKGENTWSKIADISGSSRKFQFPWNKDRPNKGFSLRISATDPAGNSSQAVTQWSPQIFNAAVLTSSVECFYCHIQIEGDVGGINFPSNEIMDKRGDSGQQFYILGKLYATNAIPDLFKRQITAKNMKVDGGLVENYDNSGVKIFPSQKDANGVPVFPALSIDSLKERMNGTVSNGDGTRYSRIYSGNLVLTGTASNPIITNGDFLVDGDL
ncbi:MAG: hypothetical protein NTX25_11235, partial [Proteobacteria bacterium]|nr:hypothetical protein [Pseudomonadota bacterium]